MEIKSILGEKVLIEWRKMESLQPDNLKMPYNIGHLKKSLLENNFAMPFFGWQNGESVFVIDGHQRREVLSELESEGVKVPELLDCQLVNAKDRQEAVKLLLSVFNSKSNPIDLEVLTEWIDLEQVEVEITSLNVVDVNEVEDEIQEILEAQEDDFDSTPPETPETVLGDLYEIGEHRLLCGDSTQTDTFEKLMQGEFADMVVTDPPYNVAYEGKTKDALTIDNDNMGNADFYKFLYDFYSALTTAVKKGGAIYVWHAHSEIANFGKAMVDAGWLLKQQLIWVKNTMVMGRQDYQWKHEPCLYGWLPGDSHKWYSDRKQTTVIDFDKPQRNGEHPTMKPIGLFSYQIENSSKKGDIVIDAFGGSGTTMVACEQIKRKARIVEYDPRYCDVIVKRMIKLDSNLKIKRNGIDETDKWLDKIK
jgi:site-specific DNA-methyltransferase (adenine-specific)